MIQEKDSYLEKAYEEADRLYAAYGAEVAYDYLMNIIYFRLYGKMKKS